MVDGTKSKTTEIVVNYRPVASDYCLQQTRYVVLWRLVVEWLPADYFAICLKVESYSLQLSLSRIRLRENIENLKICWLFLCRIRTYVATIIGGNAA